MRVLLITQDEPFYLAENIERLVRDLPSHSQVVGCVVASVSPFGKKESFFKKAKKTADIFGFEFFISYSIRFLCRKATRKGSVKKTLSRLGIPVIELRKSVNHAESLEILSSFQPDIIVSILGNEIFKENLINLAPRGCLNLHTALLPKYRGLMPTFWVLKNGESETGVSVFFVDRGIDSGPIVVQKRIPINGASLDSLIRETKRLGVDAVVEAIEKIELNTVELIENDQSKMTYFSFPSRNDVRAFLASGNRFFD